VRDETRRPAPRHSNRPLRRPPRALWASNGNGTGIAAGAVLVAVDVMLFVLSAVLMKALQGIFGVALYRFAADGDTTGGFTAAEPESAAKTRQR
jgi:hypothetical protein